ncbi:MAG: hypothetical protein Q8R18_02150 [bacterium]|nr:hypothetical protein [bacterium]
MASALLNWWDRSLFNKPIIFKKELLYHGTTYSYFSERIKTGSKYFEHIEKGLSGSEDKEVFFETNMKAAVSWACAFASRYKDQPVLVIVSTKRLRDLRRTVGSFWPYYRADKIPKEDLVMVPLEFKNELWRNRVFLNPYRDLTDECKNKIVLAEVKLRSQFIK